MLHNIDQLSLSYQRESACTRGAWLMCSACFNYRPKPSLSLFFSPPSTPRNWKGDVHGDGCVSACSLVRSRVRTKIRGETWSSFTSLAECHPRTPVIPSTYTGATTVALLRAVAFADLVNYRIRQENRVTRNGETFDHQKWNYYSLSSFQKCLERLLIYLRQS